MNLCRIEAGNIPISPMVEYYGSGKVRSCFPIGRCILETDAGELIPQFSTDDVRRKTVQALSFYENGSIRSLALEERTPVFTPAGIVLAEMLTFHPSGSVKRVFPLNGKLSGYWTQEDEETLAEPLAIDTPAGPFSAKIISLCFYEEGLLRSVTFWPGETATVPTPFGSVRTRIGVSFTRDGKVKSLEPAEPVDIDTPVGKVAAYDPDAVGINGDSNSLAFDGGRVVRVATTLTSVTAVHHTGKEFVFTPQYRDSLCSDTVQEVVPMNLVFDGIGLWITRTPEEKPVFMNFEEYEFKTEPFLPHFGSIFQELRCSV